MMLLFHEMFPLQQMNVDKEAAEGINMGPTDCQRTMRSETDVCRLTRAVLEGKVSELSVRRQG